MVLILVMVACIMRMTRKPVETKATANLESMTIFASPNWWPESSKS